MFTFLKKHNFDSISVNEISDKTINLIDIREPYEYSAGHVPSASNIPMSNLLSQPEKYLDKPKTYYIICQSGGRSSKACGELSSMDYHVVNVSGGTGSYQGKLVK